MRSLTIQVQTDKSPGINIDRLTNAFRMLVDMRQLVSNHAFDNAEDGGLSFNFTFDTSNAEALWREIQDRIYGSAEFGADMARASIAVCSSEAGWDNYSQLYHFDPSVPMEQIAQ